MPSLLQAVLRDAPALYQLVHNALDEKNLALKQLDSLTTLRLLKNKIDAYNIFLDK